ADRPDDGYIIDSLGWVYFRQGRFDEAVVELEKAVSLRPGDPTLNDHLGDAYWAVGRKREAEFQWRTALALKPDAEQQALIEAKLEKGLPPERLIPGVD
ncbi:MAG: tetratricopeptide repeat protein, partial [Zavarzinia sp.]|nr:tetratricopeptide repeat protein [Zavarzinia sp.]